jgi:uncharacterized protein (TIGR02466 family)
MTTVYQNLFPIPVGFTFLDREFTQSEMDFIVAEQTKSDPNIGNKFSSDNYILEQKTLKDLKQFCELEINNYFKEIYCPSSDVSLYITQSWVNFTEQNQYHHKHSHSNSFISGCLYIDVDEQVDKITFFKPNTETFAIDASEFNMYNSSTWWYEVKNKQLVMFPSKLEHCVEQTKSSKTRISIAFNTFFKGDIGNQKSLTRLKL